MKNKKPPVWLISTYTWDLFSSGVANNLRQFINTTNQAHAAYDKFSNATLSVGVQFSRIMFWFDVTTAGLKTTNFSIYLTLYFKRWTRFKTKHTQF